MKKSGNKPSGALFTISLVMVSVFFGGLLLTSCPSPTDLGPPPPDLSGYSIELNHSDPFTFQARGVGYENLPAALNVNVKNTGIHGTGDLSVSLSGAGADAFELSKTSLESLESDETSNNAFTVQPKEDLEAGEYTATVRVSLDNGVSASFTVTFHVDANPTPHLSASVSSHTFEQRRFGEEQHSAFTITLTNNGTGAANIAADGISLTGDRFTLANAGARNITYGGGTSTFTVVPNYTNLGFETHMTTITVTYNDGAEVTINVSFTYARAQVAKPALSETSFPFSGSQHTVALANPVSGAYELGGITSATAAGTYTATVTLTGNYEWNDGTRENLSLTWYISSGKVSKPVLTNDSFSFDGNEHEVTLVDPNTAAYSFAGETKGTTVGTYTATVTLNVNYEWEDESGTPLNLSWAIVAVVPGQVGTITATPGYAQVTLEWSAPSFTGGSDILNYQVTRSVGDTDDWANATGTTYTFTGLTNGTTYSFRVRAVNVAGAGFERTQTAIPFIEPGEVSSFTATAGNAQVTLTWAAPANTGALPVSYRVSRSDGDNWTSWTEANGTTHTYTGLTNGTTYSFRVRAVYLDLEGTISTQTATPDYNYVITGSGTEFTARVAATPISTNQDIQTVINSIRTHSAGFSTPIRIRFAETGQTLNIGTASASFSGTWRDSITLLGSITSTNATTTEGTIVVTDAVTINSIATIANTAATGIAISHRGTATLTISGGIVRNMHTNNPAATAINIGGLSGTTTSESRLLSVLGGTIQTVLGTTIRISRPGQIYITQAAYITSASHPIVRGGVGGTTIQLNDPDANLLMEGGTVSNTAEITDSLLFFYDWLNGSNLRAITNSSSTLDNAITILGGTVESYEGAAIVSSTNGRVNISEPNPDVPTLITSGNNEGTSGTIVLGTESSGRGRLRMDGGEVVNTGLAATAKAIHVRGLQYGSNTNLSIEILRGTVEANRGQAIHHNTRGNIEISGSNTLILSRNNTETNGGTIRLNHYEATSLTVSAGASVRNLANGGRSITRSTTLHTVTLTGAGQIFPAYQEPPQP